MNPIVGGALVGGGLGAIGDIIGGKMNADALREANEKNRQMQEDFARNGLRWRVEDAKAAGIHPLAALGFSQGAPSFAYQAGEPGNVASSIGERMGQNISRAMMATQTAEEKQLQQIQLASAKLDLEGKALDNQYRASQIKNMQGPAFPGSANFIPGQGNSGIKEKPAERTGLETARPAMQKGWVPDVGYARTDTGLTPVPSVDVKERIEDQIIPETAWALRNYLVPNLGLGEPPPKHMLPNGASRWEWSYTKQEWQPAGYPGKYRLFNENKGYLKGRRRGNAL